jgi:glucosylceramidase
VNPGARVIACSPCRSQLLATAFRNPDASVAVVVLNASDTKADYALWMDGNAAEVSSPPHSMQTLVF